MPNSKSFVKVEKLFYFAFALLINISNLFQILKTFYIKNDILCIFVCIHMYVIYNIYIYI